MSEETVVESITESTEPSTESVSAACVRFEQAGKLYHFSKPTNLDVAPGDWVVVQTVYGEQVGQVVRVGVPLRDDMKPLLRLASGFDMVRYQTLQERAAQFMAAAEEEIQALDQREVKPVSAEFTLDGDLALFCYVGNLDNNLRAQLRRKLASRMHCRVELHFVGPRDQAKALGGYGVCGEQRCCSRFLSEFQAVSIRMAKDQSISMAPTDITGICGRLRCCLGYEHTTYKEISADFPKRKARVRTPQGLGRVLDWDVLKGEIIVEIPPDGPRQDRARVRFSVEEVEVEPQS